MSPLAACARFWWSFSSGLCSLSLLKPSAFLSFVLDAAPAAVYHWSPARALMKVVLDTQPGLQRWLGDDVSSGDVFVLKWVAMLLPTRRVTARDSAVWVFYLALFFIHAHTAGGLGPGAPRTRGVLGRHFGLKRLKRSEGCVSTKWRSWNGGVARLAAGVFISHHADLMETPGGELRICCSWAKKRHFVLQSF